MDVQLSFHYNRCCNVWIDGCIFAIRAECESEELSVKVKLSQRQGDELSYLGVQPLLFHIKKTPVWLGHVTDQHAAN